MAASRLLSILGAALVCHGVTHAQQTKFARPFAPQDGIVAPIEKPARDEICLNGSWQFQPADSRTTPSPDRWDKTPIRIPSPWNVNSFPDDQGLGGDFRCFPSYPKAWESVKTAWLRRTISIPPKWRGKQLILHFQAVAGQTQVLVNGRLVATHFDNFLPFEVDITDDIHVGDGNELLVRVQKASLSDVQGKYGRRTYQGGSMWGQAIAGIWQDVSLTALPPVHISDVFVKPNVESDQLTAAITIQNDSNHTELVTVRGDVHSWINHANKRGVEAAEPKWSLDEAPNLHLDPVHIQVPAHGSASATLSLNNIGPKLKRWSPTTPNLYALICRTDEDTKYTRFGWRQISFQGPKVLLNGQPIVMKGDSWHFMGIPQMTRRYAWAWFQTLHDAGLNAVRLHAEPYPSFYLDMADEMGILVLDETAVWASDGGPKLDDPTFWNDTNRHLTELILRDRNHPSVFGWSVSNEVMAVVRNVFHAPKEIENQASSMNRIWLQTCRLTDPTRPWISADGEEDGQGALPTYVIHYGDRGTMDRAIATGKPWGVGEAGPAYYGTPQQISQQAHDPLAYRSMEDRMQGVAKVSYESLIDQRTKGASYRSVFNLVWYGLQPLELGMKDTTKPPTLSDGIFFDPFVEGKPGVQPERLGPYSSTLNPGYDPKLPMYRPWPLFDAIRDAQAEPPVPFKPSFQPIQQTPRTSIEPEVKSVQVLAGPGGKLAPALTDLGVTISPDSNTIFIDGANPPAPEAKAKIEQKLAAGGTVFVWDAAPATLPQLNALLPYPLELTNRSSSSLVTFDDPLVAGLTLSDLYFTELSPSTILTSGLSGPLMSHAKSLLSACNTDWRLWNGQPETTKTAKILRSEREAKPSGVAYAELLVGKGRLLLCNLPPDPATSQSAALNRAILSNLGISLGEGSRDHNLLNPAGQITAALVAGPFPAASTTDGLAANYIWPDWPMTKGVIADGKVWTLIKSNPDGAFPLLTAKENSSVDYLSFWIYSPKPLDNLLLDPHLPTVDLKIGSAPAAQIWLDGAPLKTQIINKTTVASPLLLKQDWNHIVVKLVLNPGDPHPTIELTCNQPDFPSHLRVAFEKPN